MFVRKINPVEFIIVIALIIWTLSFSYMVNNESKMSSKQVKILEKKYEENEKKIEKKETYKRLQSYGYELNLIDNLIKYKDSQINWYEFFQDFSKSVPSNTTIKLISYDDNNETVNISMVAPAKERILQTLQELNYFRWLTEMNFNEISQEKLSFKNDRREYFWYWANVIMWIDREYLDTKYENIRRFKNAKYSLSNRENVKEVEKSSLEDLKNLETLSWSIMNKLIQEEGYSWSTQ